MNIKIAVLALAALTVSAAKAQDVIFDTGVQNVVTFNGSLTNLGLSSGNIAAGLEQRWYAMPCVIPAGGASMNKIWVRGFVPLGFEFLNFKVRMWTRSGLASGPVPANEVDLNGASAGNEITVANPGAVYDPRFKAEAFFGPPNDRRLFILDGFTPVTLPAGEYWFSVYADGDNNGSGFVNFAWFVGAHGDNVGLNREAGFYRQANLAGGFLPYAPASITPYAFMGDPAERWNACFTLWGTAGRTAQNYFGEVMWNDYVGNAPPYDDALNPKPLDFIYRVAITNPNNSNAVVAFRYLRTIDQEPVTGDFDSPGVPDFDFSPQYQYYAPVAAAAGITNTELTWQANNYLGVRNSHDLSVNSGTFNRDWNLKNGDVDLDGEVGPGDFGILSAEFGNAAPGSAWADWNAWVNSAAGQADLDEDGEVGPSDFGILSSNFGEASE